MITKWDRTYCTLLKKILDEGEAFENRTGIDTKSIEGVGFKLNIDEEFPILESKKVFVKNALTELLWIYQAKSNNVSWLKERGNNTWNEREIDELGYWTATQNVPVNGKYEKQEIKKFFGKEYKGTIGTAYGWINNRFNQPNKLLKTLKENPSDRPMIISLWQDEYLGTAVLPSCVWSSEWTVSNGRLNAFVHQRSADVPVGLPFNVTQYAILLSLFAKVSNLEVGNLNWSIMDAHIYENQIEEVRLQLKRFTLMEYYNELIKEDLVRTLEFMTSRLNYYKNYLLNNPNGYDQELTMNINNLEEKILVINHLLNRKNPYLSIADKDDFFTFDNSEHNKDIKLIDYTSLPYIRMKVTK